MLQLQGLAPLFLIVERDQQLNVPLRQLAALQLE
jgi:hypothetical protein